MDDYEKKELLGEGSFGKVHRVIEKSTKKVYAMKSLKVKEDSEKVIANEIEIMKNISAMSNPNIVSYITSFIITERKRYIIIMEYCSGKSLKKIIKEYKNKKEMISEDRKSVV